MINSTANIRSTEAQPNEEIICGYSMEGMQPSEKVTAKQDGHSIKTDQRLNRSRSPVPLTISPSSSDLTTPQQLPIVIPDSPGNGGQHELPLPVVLTTSLNLKQHTLPMADNSSNNFFLSSNASQSTSQHAPTHTHPPEGNNFFTMLQNEGSYPSQDKSTLHVHQHDRHSLPRQQMTMPQHISLDGPQCSTSPTFSRSDKRSVSTSPRHRRVQTDSTSKDDDVNTIEPPRRSLSQPEDPPVFLPQKGVMIGGGDMLSSEPPASNNFYELPAVNFHLRKGKLLIVINSN